jgi:hypothetical protein
LGRVGVGEFPIVGLGESVGAEVGVEEGEGEGPGMLLDKYQAALATAAIAMITTIIMVAKMFLFIVIPSLFQ